MLSSNSNHNLDYDIFGPFKVSRKEAGYLNTDPKAKRDFWERVDQSKKGLSKACGCYVISVRNVVWYVGLTHNGFVHECFTPTKINRFNEAIAEGKRGILLSLTGSPNTARPVCQTIFQPQGYRQIGGDVDSLFALKHMRTY